MIVTCSSINLSLSWLSNFQWIKTEIPSQDIYKYSYLFLHKFGPEIADLLLHGVVLTLQAGLRLQLLLVGAVGGRGLLVQDPELFLNVEHLLQKVI